MTSPFTRRALLIGALPAAALGLSACGSSRTSSTASASGSASGSASATSESTAAASASASATPSSSASETASASATADDGYVGFRLNREVPGAGTATLYTDFQCPYCAKAEPKFEEAAKKLDGVLNVTARHMPLSMHANAVPAAEAQGKHLEMADKLFATQNDWKGIKERDKLRTLFNDYAKELGLNTEEFDKVLLASDTVKPIQRDYEHAVKIGVKGTPTFAVNDKVIEGLDSSSSVDDLVSTFKREAGVK